MHQPERWTTGYDAAVVNSRAIGHRTDCTGYAPRRTSTTAVVASLHVALNTALADYIPSRLGSTTRKADCGMRVRPILFVLRRWPFGAANLSDTLDRRRRGHTGSGGRIGAGVAPMSGRRP